MSITATVENDTIKLPVGVHVPDGTKVSIETVPATEQGADERVDWTAHWQWFDEVWGGKLTPGKPASEIVIEGRR